MKKIDKIKNIKGQIALVVLLVSAVILTLGLSASRKAVTDIKVDTNEESLKQAFNTAESGLNSYINSGVTNYTDSNSGVGATITSNPIGGGNSLVSEGLVLSGMNQLFWLVDHDDQGNIGGSFYPSNSTLTLTVDFIGAVKIDYFYKSGNVYSVKRSGYNFSSASPTVAGFTYSASKSISIAIGSENPLLIVVTPIGGSTTLSLSGTSNFPKQGEDLTSVGTTNNGTKTQIKTKNIYQVPSFLFESIMAKNTIQ